MASKAVEEAVQARLEANWTTTPILTENQEGDAPSDGSSFIILQFPASETRRLTINDRWFQEQGGFRVVINTARGAGVDEIRNAGEEIASIFRYATFDGVHCTDVSEPFTDDNSDQGNYWQGYLTVSYVRTFKDT